MANSQVFSEMYILAEYECLGWHLFPLNTVKIFPIS